MLIGTQVNNAIPKKNFQKEKLFLHHFSRTYLSHEPLKKKLAFFTELYTFYTPRLNVNS